MSVECTLWGLIHSNCFGLTHSVPLHRFLMIPSQVVCLSNSIGTIHSIKRLSQSSLRSKAWLHLRYSQHWLVPSESLFPPTKFIWFHITTQFCFQTFGNTRPDLYVTKTVVLNTSFCPLGITSKSWTSCSLHHQDLEGQMQFENRFEPSIKQGQPPSLTQNFLSTRHSQKHR